MSNKIRLPEGVQPVNYNLFFDIDLEKFRFSGKEVIDVKIGRPAAKIMLHSSGLKIKNASVLSGGKTIKARTGENTKLEQLILGFDERITGNAKLFLEFEGELTDNMIGLYRSRYTEKKSERYMATTQFEATYARRAFPCFDEPACKSTFDVAMRINKDLQAISNMPVKEEQKEGDKKTIVFHTTPKMSTYLLYLGVGKFDLLEGRAGKIALRVITTPGKKTQAELALDLTKKFLDYFQKYSGIPYPLPKLDMIAIPDFASGAMENWGAITFRETALLFDPAVTSIAVKKRIAMIIAHELWHQWSGNLVTMEWWNDLWLNESFATFMAYKAVDHFFPQWNIWEDFILEETDTAFDEDSIASTHPIEMQVNDPSQLEEIFDAISYNKGGSVLRMLESYTGEKDFRKSVSKYLHEHEYGNATAGDLWKSLAGTSKKPIKDMATVWMRQPGYPLVTANMKGNALELSQKRFVFNKKDNSVWPIPLSIKTGNRLFTYIMDKKSKKIPLPSKQFKINYGQTGFYRVKYGEKELSNLKAVIADKKLPPVDRWGVQSDMFRLCRHGEITIDKYLDFIKSYSKEDSYLVLSSIFGSMQSIYFVFSHEDFWNSIWPEFGNLFRGTFSSALQRLGWEPKNNEREKDALVRDLAIRYMGFAEDKDAERKALEKLEKYVNGKELHPNIRSAVFSVAAGCDSDVYDKMLGIYERSNSPEEKRQILSALGHFKDATTLGNALNFSISKNVRKQDIYVTFVSAASNPAARSILLDWAGRNWKQLESYRHSHRLLLYIVGSLITAYVTKDKELELKRFFRTHPVDYKMTVDKSFDRVERNILWLRKNREILAKYFER